MSKVRPDALLLAYSQVAIIEAMSSGMPRNEALDEAWAMYYSELAPEENSAQDAPPIQHLNNEMFEAAGRGDRAEAKRLVLAWEEVRRLSKRYSRNCLARSAAINAALLQTPEEGGVELGDVELERVIWLLETVRRVAEGQDHLAAARAAHDASLGKPRQKRKPVENDWLSKEVTSALDAIWTALSRPEPRPMAFYD